ncbi:MAG: T9SS type A sorting domain-containing protein [Cryomorphaceae bacterium]|nr:T9SS type A sorting domain-containing protein [Cryomorphaceae bacterium]
MRKILITLSALLAMFTVFGQQDTIRTAPPLTGNTSTSTGSGISMNVHAYNSINILEFASNTTGASGYEIWFSPDSVSGPPNISAAGGWVLHETGSVTAPAAMGFIQLNDPLNIPAGETYGIFYRLIGASVRYTSSPTPSTFVDQNVRLEVGTLAGYAGVPPTPTIHPRGFTGEIVYELAVRAPNDAGVIALDSPRAFCPGTHDVIASVRNFGTNIIDSVLVNWTLNGVAQTPFMLRQPLDTVGGFGFNIRQVTLGSVTLLANQSANLSIWTSMPNGMMDTINFNDTIHRTIRPSIEGTYTINSFAPTAGTNFQNFSDLASILNDFGICGPVIVNVAPNSGPYNERVVFDEIDGTSAVNTITINGNGNTLTFAATLTDERSTMVLNGADYITIDSLNINGTGATYAWALQLTNGADHNTFKNCKFEVSTTSSSTFVSNIVMSGSLTSPTQAGNCGSYNTFENNIHIGGYYGFTMNGSSAASKDVGNTIKNSVFEDFALYGLYIRSQDLLTIEGNDINRINRTSTSTFYGIFLSTGIEGAKILGNAVHDNCTSDPGSTSSAYPIYLSSATGTGGNPNIMANNLVYNMNNQGLTYTMYFIGALNNFWKIYHNTIVIDDPSSVSTSAIRNVFVSGAQNNMEIKNNIFYLDRGNGSAQHQMYFTSAAHNVDVDYNVYYTPNSAVTFGYNGLNINTFADWQLAGFDGNSYDADPFFVGTGPTPLRPRSTIFDDGGTNLLSDVPTDFEGVARTTAPDPGAFEFVPPQGVDMSILRFLSPDGSCPGTVNVVIEVANFATDTAETIKVNWSVNNVPQTPVIVTASFFPGNLVPVTLGTFTLTASGIFDIEASIDSVFPGPDIDFANNSASIIGYRAGLSGTFTINQLAASSPTNYNSFQDAADALNSYGVCGPVVFNVVPGTGPYLERVELNQIQGASAANTITFNGNGNTLDYSATGSVDRTTFSLNGSDYVTVDSLIIVASGAQYGWVVYLGNEANHNTFKNCVMETNTTSTSTFYSNVVMSANPVSPTTYGNVGNYNTFINNHHIGGYYGFTMCGENTSNRNFGNKVINSTFDDFYLYGFFITSQDSLVLDGNDLNRENRTSLSTFYGMYLINGMSGAQIINNRIHDIATQNTTSTLTAYPVYMSSATGSSGNQNVFANNLFYNMNNSGINYVIYLVGTLNNFWSFYHNTIVLDNPSSTSTSAARLLFISGAQNDMDFKNNIFYLNRPSSPGYFVYQTSALANVNFDNNVYFSPDLNSLTFGYLGANLNSFSDWQTAGFDPNGMLENPQFLGSGNDFYRPTVGVVKAVGANVLSVVPADIEGVARTTSPDPGVYQFNPLPCTGAYDFNLDTVYPGNAEISWSSYGNVTEWQVEWDVCGFVPGSGLGNLDSVVTNNTNYQLANLPSGQCICVFVREKCPLGGYGNWTGPIEICVPIENDAEMVSLVKPSNLSCGDSLLDVWVEIRNNGFNPITSLPINVNISGDITATMNFTYTGNLLENEIDTVNVGSFNGYFGGYINIEAIASLPNDLNSSNDTVRIDSLIIIPYQPVVQGANYCLGDDSVTVSGLPIPGATYNWFNVATGGTPFASTPTVTVNPATTPNVYVEYLDLQDSLLTTTIAGNGQNGNMVDFVVKNTINIYAFDMLPSTTTAAAGFEIYYKVGSYQGSEDNPANWTLVQTYTNQSVTMDVLHRLNLSTPLTLSAGLTYSFYLTRTDNSVRYTSTTNEFAVYVSNNDLDILEGIGKQYPFSSTFRPRMWNGQVIYGSEACSDIRVSVPLNAVNPATANFTFNQISHTVGFQNTSMEADSVTWIIDNQTFSGDTVSYQFPRTDSFEVCLVAYNSCGSDTICQWVWAENVSISTFDVVDELEIFPNPSEGRFNLSFTQNFLSDVRIELLDLSGKTILVEHHKNFQGSFSKDYNHQKLSSGMYMLRLQNRDGVISRRIIIGK